MAHRNSRLSLGTWELRPAAQRLTEEEGAAFEVTGVCTSWSLDLASDLFWIQAKSRTRLENQSVPEATDLDRLGRNLVWNPLQSSPVSGLRQGAERSWEVVGDIKASISTGQCPQRNAS